jgi:hypothetical protein
LGIVTRCKTRNVASLRGYSYDKESYFNHNAKEYFGLFKRPEPVVQNKLPRQKILSNTQLLVEACISEIVKNRIDITDGYQRWFELGCSLSDEFGEAGRNYFHKVSQYYSRYRQHDADKQFDECLKHTYKFTIATFFHICKGFNICYRK